MLFETEANRRERSECRSGMLASVRGVRSRDQERQDTRRWEKTKSRMMADMKEKRVDEGRIVLVAEKQEESLKGQPIIMGDGWCRSGVAWRATYGCIGGSFQGHFLRSLCTLVLGTSTSGSGTTTRTYLTYLP